MKSTVWNRIDAAAKNLTPFGITLILVLIGVVPLFLPVYARVAPLLPVMAVYHWAMHRPRLLPTYAVFLIGFLQDVLTGMPIGVNIVVFLTVYGVVVSQRRFFADKSFLVSWLGFALVAAGAAAESWILVSAIHFAMVDARAVFVQYLVTLGCFPVLAWFFLSWQRSVLGQG
ncbi:MAG: rod shape-determining protein MreD [Rhodospirillales bacterium]|nr:rod shape-determining protein MreD [Rhodospirillales bacterium]